MTFIMLLNANYLHRVPRQANRQGGQPDHHPPSDAKLSEKDAVEPQEICRSRGARRVKQG
jgi:hypothetical protein